ncbi:hypothetical protein P153DRAFT_56043 [Dothidotthia symphoricarpi CBS 119687]|uniref:Uncharacterized protein n=1 Tax=Dothidotthia symphoricarpi CBS 119687 TaxID=1392245 RepID=A0A6A6A8C3_9PLEO|nr:uncharacterized protein P153DRAFT_56043 [Dothidotthia symphoricarpi CBS 119687]KAF2127806.1 hypothetical protein P153DRAFT_56043 [Dothidotthia symphoricarpi CBS 119687]
MATTSSSFHIPFPRNFLSVNTPIKKSKVNMPAAAEPEQPAHGFLSNVAHHGPRHASISSLSSIGSVSDTAAPSALAPDSAGSPRLGPAVFAPLALNAKHDVLPPSTAREVSAKTFFIPGGFLSNRA